MYIFPAIEDSIMKQMRFINSGKNFGIKTLMKFIEKHAEAKFKLPIDAHRIENYDQQKEEEPTDDSSKKTPGGGA